MPLTITKSVAQLLKEETIVAHTKAENLLVPKISSIKTFGDYAALLKMFYGYFHPIEQIIRKYITVDILSDIDERRNSLFILHDLKALNYSTEHMSVCNEIPQIKNIADAFGCLYVLEGSTLGGRMISKMLMKNFYIRFDESNLNFFNGYKESTGARWAHFLSVINEQEENEGAMISAAIETFDGLTKWMEKTL